MFSVPTITWRCSQPQSYTVLHRRPRSAFRWWLIGHCRRSESAARCSSSYAMRRLAVGGRRVPPPWPAFTVSTPGTTAIDLARWPAHAGGLSYVRDILADLKSSLRKRDLIESLHQTTDTGAVQRLGWLLDSTSARGLARSDSQNRRAIALLNP